MNNWMYTARRNKLHTDVREYEWHREAEYTYGGRDYVGTNALLEPESCLSVGDALFLMI